MPHSSETTWATEQAIASDLCQKLEELVYEVQEKYASMLEKYQFSGGTDTTFANLLFHGDGSLTLATTEDIAKVTDLRQAMTAADEFADFANNVAVTTANRIANWRRMS